jgi:hypothetical protein
MIAQNKALEAVLKPGLLIFNLGSGIHNEIQPDPGKNYPISATLVASYGKNGR